MQNFFGGSLELNALQVQVFVAIDNWDNSNYPYFLTSGAFIAPRLLCTGWFWLWNEMQIC